MSTSNVSRHGPRVARWLGGPGLVAATALVLAGAAPATAGLPKPDSLPGVVTVLQFGAVPSDGKDDTAGMQAAADHVCENPGSTLIYPPGTYNLDTVVEDETYREALRSQDMSLIGIQYKDCHDVNVTGIGATIDVKGDFEKTAVEPIGHANYWSADKLAFNAFILQNASWFSLSGFTIDGNVDEMTQAVPPGMQLQEGFEDGVFLHSGHDIRLHDLTIHHMATDGIMLNLARDVEIRRVRISNNIRQALSINQARNVLVSDSQLRDTGVVGTAPNSYPMHSPARGVDIEPECNPEGAEWAKRDGNGKQTDACETLVGMTGNILFERVRVTGNLGGGIAMPHGQSSANVTVRDSFLQHPLGKGGYALTMGVVGGIVEDSTIDGQNGSAVWCTTYGAKVQLTSPVWAEYLRLLATDSSPIARKIHRQTDPTFSTTVRRSEIEGQGTKFLCHIATPVLRIVDNTIRGTVLPTPPETNWYPTYGHLTVYSGTPGAACSSGHDWGKDITIEGNDIFIPHRAPRGQEGHGQINYCGKSIELRGNSYRTDTDNPTNPLRVYYNENQGVGSVTKDCFPPSGAIIPVNESGQRYELTSSGTQHCLTIPTS